MTLQEVAPFIPLIILVLILIYLSFREKSSNDRFFTRYASDEPTRSWVAYTGTVPQGWWGSEPWGEALPVPPTADQND